MRNRPTWSTRVRRRWSCACNHLILILLPQPLPHQPLHREGGGARGRCLCCSRRKTSSMVTIWAIAVWALFLLDAEQKEAAELAQRQLPLADLLAAVLLGLVIIARRRRRRFCCPPAPTIISWVRVHIVTSSSRPRAASRPLPVAVSSPISLSRPQADVMWSGSSRFSSNSSGGSRLSVPLRCRS